LEPEPEPQAWSVPSNPKRRNDEHDQPSRHDPAFTLPARTRCQQVQRPKPGASPERFRGPGSRGAPSAESRTASCPRAPGQSPRAEWPFLLNRRRRARRQNRRRPPARLHPPVLMSWRPRTWCFVAARPVLVESPRGSVNGPTIAREDGYRKCRSGECPLLRARVTDPECGHNGVQKRGHSRNSIVWEYHEVPVLRGSSRSVATASRGSRDSAVYIGPDVVAVACLRRALAGALHLARRVPPPRPPSRRAATSKTSQPTSGSGPLPGPR